MMGLFHHIAKAVKHVAKEVVHTVTHPQDVIKTAVHGVSELGHGLDDVVHGNFKEGLGELANGVKHVADPAHIVGMTHELTRPITNPINKALAQGIKGITGHNVLGSHPLNAIGTVAASVATGGAAGALMEGASLAGGLAAGLGALEGAGASIASGLGTGLSTLGFDTAGSTVSGWGSTLSAMAADNAATAAASEGTGNWLSHAVDKVDEVAQHAQSAVKSVFTHADPTAGGTYAGNGFATGNWEASSASSTFNGGIGSEGLGAENAIAPTSTQFSGNAGTVFSNLSKAPVETGDTMGFGFGHYVQTAGAGQMGIMAPNDAALGASVTGSSGGYTALGKAATGQLGTGGVGLYGETAGGVINASTGPTSLFNYGANYAVPNNWTDAVKSLSHNSGQPQKDKPKMDPSKSGGDDDLSFAKTKAMGLDDPRYKWMDIANPDLNIDLDTNLQVKQFKPVADFQPGGDYKPVNFTNY